LDTLYQTTKDVRLRKRAQMMLLAAEKRLTAPDIAAIVRDDEQKCHSASRTQAVLG